MPGGCTRPYAVCVAALAAAACQSVGTLAQTAPAPASEAAPPPPRPPHVQSGITENVGSVLLMYHKPEDNLPTWAIVLLCLGALGAQVVFLITIIILRKKKKRINAMLEERAAAAKAAAAAAADAEAGLLDGVPKAGLGGKEGVEVGKVDSDQNSFDGGCAGKGEMDSAADSAKAPAGHAGQAAGGTLGTLGTQPAFQDDSCHGKPSTPGS